LLPIPSIAEFNYLLLKIEDVHCAKLLTYGCPGSQVKKLTALYTREEKKKTPPYNIAGEKLIAMQMENLLLREKLTKASQILNEEVFLWMKDRLPG
jgi:hypothetical protein